MDSGLLNVFHDDPFDGNYVKYDNDTDFWSSSSDTMGLQLTETLHGILPMTATDDVADIYSNTILKDDFHLENKDATSSTFQTKNALIYDDYSEQHLVGGGGNIEIVTVDPNSIDFDTDSGGDDDDDDVGDDDDDDDDNDSQHSNSTFRTRTDSSSIGDYESHSSDYDDEDTPSNHVQREKLENALISRDVFADVPELESGLLAPDDLMLDSGFKLPLESIVGSKNRTISTNTIGSDVDALGLQIDANTFDLADFITKDDFALSASSMSTTASTTPKAKVIAPPAIGNYSFVRPVVQLISSNHSDSDSDSDVIVDVETVELDAEQEKLLWRSRNVVAIGDGDDVPFVDNVKQDPSWKPQQTKKTETVAKELKVHPTTAIAAATAATTTQSTPATSNSQQNFGRNFSVVPSKRQCDILKGKFGCGRGKNISIQRNGKIAAKKVADTAVSAVVPKNPAVDKTEKPTPTQQVSPTIPKMGMGLGGKNLSLIKHDRHSISEQSSEENVTPVKVPAKAVSPQQQEAPVATAVKRKLNLEEYKKRRSENGMSNGKLESYKIPKLDKPTIEPKQCTTSKTNVQTPPSTKSPPVISPTKHSVEVTSIVKSLKQQMLQKPATDPITEARNKVLRMQEIKRAQQLRIIDSAVTAKVPRVTKMLPLREIMKDSFSSAADEELKTTAATAKAHPDYEEIIIISASCNTDISIPPTGVNMAAGNQEFGTANNAASRSLLKSSSLLYNISNSYNKKQSNENVKISTSSLIASIQDVVVKQTMPMVESEATTKTSNNQSNTNTTQSISKNALDADQHGEDKIIMHLRKDRMRKQTSTMATQTDFQPEFPPLPLPKLTVMHKPRERIRKKKTHRNYRKSNAEATATSSSSSSSDDSDSHSRSRTPVASYRSRSRSAGADSGSSSSERMRQCDAAGGGYSSRSSRRHRSSISSSYSESENISRSHRRRPHKSTSYKQRTKKHSRSSSSSSLSDYSERRSRTRSRSPLYRRSHSRSRSRSRSRQRGAYKNNKNYVDRNVSQPAVEERRIVYVGRIEAETTKEMLRRKFLPYGSIKQITIHYKDTGMKYGFVTYEHPKDAFTVIDTSAHDSQINMYDISFGGRRAFCRASYADLDNAGINTYQSYVFPKAPAVPQPEDSFEALLLKVKAKMNATKSSNNNNNNNNTDTNKI